MLQRHYFMAGALGTLLLLIFLGIFLHGFVPALPAALFQRNPSVTSPTTGLFIHRGYEAQPNERGSVLLEAGENLQNFEALSFTFAVDSARAEIIRVRRTAVTQNFEISTNFPAPGVVHVALAGEPREVSQGQSLLEIELQLRENTVNTAGTRLELQLIDTSYLLSGNQLRSTSHDGLITVLTNQNALSLPFTPVITDIDPTVYPLVQHRAMTIHGRALPSFPRVLLGSRPLPVLSASETEILAMIPEDTAPGAYAVSVESLLADEKVVVFRAIAPLGSVDILEELLFFSPNPVLYNAQNKNPEVTLWVPVHNPLGPGDPVIGSVDLSRIGGDPNLIFSGVGTPALGPGGTMVNWFRVPVSGTFRLPDDLDSNVDYPVTIRVENRTQTRDSVTQLLQLRSQIPQGDSPFFGSIETVPSTPVSGNRITFYADVTDRDGIETVERVAVRLLSLQGGLQELQPVLSIPTGDAPLATMTFATTYAIPQSVVPGTYLLEFSARDKDGNETTNQFPLVVRAPGTSNVGSPPQFSGRLEARPATARPGGTVDFFAGVRDPDGTQTISLMNIDLISIGGAIAAMTPLLPSSTIGTLPVVYTTTFTLPTNIAAGTYDLQVRAVDVNGLEAQTSISLTVDASQGGGQGGAPEFSGRREASPSIAPLGGKVEFFVSVRDPEGSDTIRQVTIDLVDIGGSILSLDPAVAPVAGSTQPVVYTGDFTLPSSTLPGVYSLGVTAVDQDGNLTRTTLALTVSAVSRQGSVPTVLQLFATPRDVPADGKSDVSFTVEVEDADGIDDVTSVRINLAPLNLGIEFLDLQSGGGNASTKGIFTSKKVRIPTSVRPAVFDLQVEVEDKEGNRVQRLLRLNVGQKTATGSPPELRDVRFVPEVGRPGKNVDLFVEVKDANGTDNITVVADLTDLRGSVKELNPLIRFPSGTLASQNTFSVENLNLPDDLPTGIYDIPITVIDDTGNIVVGGARLRVEKGGKEEGQPPSITVVRSFQSPRVLPNDGNTKGEIHVLVHDADDDVATVIANLGSLGEANSASRRDGIGDTELLCNESRSIVCMQPSVPEGPTDRWFFLKEIVIPPTTLPSADPYPLTITAIDAKGHTAKETFPFLIGGPDTKQQLTVQPAFTTIVPVNESALELLVSAPIATATTDRGGKQFVLQPTLNALATARVTRVSWDTTAKLLYLQTTALTPGETYTLTAVSGVSGVTPLTDVHGNRFTQDQGGSIVFTAYTSTGARPHIEHVTVLDANHLEVRFATPVLPSSVHPDLLPSRAHVQSKTSGEEVPVRGGVLLENARTLRLTVDNLREGDRYRLRIAGVLAPGLLEAPPPGAEYTFIVVFPRAASDACGPIVLPTADLNEDGKVNFGDFALFSSVYGTDYTLTDNACTQQASAPPPQAPPLSRSSSPPPSGNKFGGEIPPIKIPGL